MRTPHLVADLPDDTSIGLLAYAHRKNGDCSDIELFVPAGRLDRAAFSNVVSP